MKSLQHIKIEFIHLLAIFILILSFVFFFIISFWIPAGVNHNIGEVKTALIGFDSLIIGYFYGSSRSSAKKDEVIKELQQDNNNPTV